MAKVARVNRAEDIPASNPDGSMDSRSLETRRPRRHENGADPGARKNMPIFLCERLWPSAAVRVRTRAAFSSFRSETRNGLSNWHCRDFWAESPPEIANGNVRSPNSRWPAPGMAASLQTADTLPDGTIFSPTFMPLSAGTRLGPYEILAPIGAGGMGEVYKARDTRLDRIVAIKVSREQFSERFEREARAVAALNHPHICQLYDVGPNYLVMEFVDGAPLQGPLPIEKAVEYAGQILDALDAAHRKGITHRDLKPANILVTKQGVVLQLSGTADW